MKPAPFRYVRAESTAEAVELLREHGDDARILAGGQSLGALLNLRLVRPAVLVDIMRIDALASVRRDGDCLVTGATFNQADALQDPQVAAGAPLLARALPHVGHYQTRNRGTVGGSIAHADPSAEMPLALLVTGGFVLVAAAGGTRRVPAEEFFVAPLVTSRREDELVLGIQWNTWEGRTGCAFAEFATREGDFAIAAGACAVRVSDDGVVERLSLGFAGVGDRPLLADTGEIEGTPVGQLDSLALEEIKVPGMQPRSDVHATGPYRTHLVELLCRRLVTSAVRDASARGEQHA